MSREHATITVRHALERLVTGSEWDGLFQEPDPDAFKERLEKFLIELYVYWPPDLFAVTWTLLKESGAYRMAVEPHEAWPSLERAAEIQDAAQAWMEDIPVSPSGIARIPTTPAHQQLDSYRVRLEGGLLPLLETPLDALTWKQVTLLLDLHALADEACAWLRPRVEERSSGSTALGSHPQAPEAKPSRTYAKDLLSRSGSLSHFSPKIIQVVFKHSLAVRGITMEALSRYVGADRSEVDITYTVANTALRAEASAPLNLLLVPWPLEIQPSDFQPVPPAERPLYNAPGYGFFAYDPAASRSTEKSVETILALLKRARERHGRVDGIILPELALERGELDDLKRALLGADQGVDSTPPFIITGLRSPADRSNQAVFAFPSDMALGGWVELQQDKHHRWSLDNSQIMTYGLASVLHTGTTWWEDLEMKPRRLNLITTENHSLKLCVLVCEDLARQEPVNQLLRAVGPSLVVALLMDGPQLKGRWPGMYAGVLAEDPGCAVLTFSSLGMVQRSRPDGCSVSRGVALWRDPTQTRELSLDSGCNGMLLTLCEEESDVWTADRRNAGEKGIPASRWVLKSACSL